LLTGCVAAALVACASSSPAVPNSAHGSRTYSRVLVDASFKEDFRREVERAAVTKLKAAHIDAASSLDLALDPDPDGSEKTKLLEAGFDCVLRFARGPTVLRISNVLNGQLRDIVDGGTVWQEQIRTPVETSFTARELIIEGVEMIADDLIKSKVLLNKPEPAPNTGPTTNHGPGEAHGTYLDSVWD
jgi:hypothetical protein